MAGTTPILIARVCRLRRFEEASFVTAQDDFCARTLQVAEAKLLGRGKRAIVTRDGLGTGGDRQFGDRDFKVVTRR